MYKKKFFLVLIMLSGFVLSACSAKQPNLPLATTKSSILADLNILPQNLLVYASKAGAKKILLDRERQNRQDAQFNSLFFEAWEGAHATVSASEAFEIFGMSQKSRPIGWNADYRHWTTEAWQALADNANREKYPSRLQKAITIRSTPLREAPTMQPRYGNPKKPGEGYPFDMFMYANLPPGMPLLITHTSKDKRWLYAETALLSGWVAAKNIAITDADFRKKYKNGIYAAILRDNVMLQDREDHLCRADVGAVFPVQKHSQSTITLLVPFRNADGMAELNPVQVKKSDAAVKPLQFTPAALASIGNTLLGQPYGWGGLDGKRDCSQLMRDLFIPFGIWLPRNSSAQAKSWNYIPFGEKTADEKDQFILKKGKAFATLLWLKGHITLYIGNYYGKPVMLHDMWGIRTEKDGEEGRYVVGRIVITTTRPGTEIAFIQDRHGLVNRMRGMSILQ